MNEENRDPELQGVRETWEAPLPNPGMRDRILRVCDRELHRTGFPWFLTAVAALVLVVAFAASRSELRIRRPVNVPQAFQESAQRRTTPEHAVVVELRKTQPRLARSVGRQAFHVSDRPAGLPMTDFYPLMDVPPPFGDGILVRVIVPASTMRIAGLPEWEGQMEANVEADLLIGEDGMARAIRFVGFD